MKSIFSQLECTQTEKHFLSYTLKYGFQYIKHITEKFKNILIFSIN